MRHVDIVVFAVRADHWNAVARDWHARPTRYLLARQAAQPPSIGNATPVINAAPGEQR